MKKDPKIFLAHILESIKEIENHVKKFSKDDFLRDIKTQDAVIRRMEIIGEASNNLPNEFKKKYPLEWREIGGMRNKLIHEYFGVDVSLVWAVIKNDLPKFKKQIGKLLESF